ncbi:MAG: putative ATPase [Myxococcota bacterium]
MDLFDQNVASGAPMAERLRPQTLDEVIGQDQAVGKGTFLFQAIAEDRVPSIILWGPPGTGKTTLANVIARVTRHEFVAFSAVLGGVKDIRRIVAEAAERRRMRRKRTLLFVDEIHRFNKAQQDAFLPHVENGNIVLVGATTENPSFEINSALLSRARVVRLRRLEPEDLVEILRRGLEIAEGQGTDEVLLSIANHADGDARRALNLLESALADGKGVVTEEVIGRVQHAAPVVHDRGGDAHYEVVSAFIKSMRGSDPDATLYYLARMLEGGENPRFIMRRLVIFAAEDVSNADPRALQVAVSAAQGFEQIGLPEGQLLMAQAATFLATAPKSNASYVGLKAARKAVRETGSLEVPLHLRNAATGLMADFGHGQGYQYPHEYGGWVKQQYLPDEIAKAQFYQPTGNGYEARVKQWLDQTRAERGTGDDDDTPDDAG